MINHFECLKCGDCCKNFGSNDSFSGLPLFEWEKKEFERLAKERGIFLNINSTNIIYDKKSKTYVNISYFMENQPCPFLKDNQCAVYEKRPIVCRSFPLARNPVIDDEHLGLNCFMHCSNFNSNLFLKEKLKIKENKSFLIKEKKFIEEYKKFFGETVLIYESIHSNIWKYVKKKIIELEGNNITSFKDVKEILGNKQKIIPFFEFLVKINNITEKEKREIITHLLSEEKAKERLFLK